MKHFAWKAQLTPGSLDAYGAAHSKMSPEMRAFLRRAGYKDYRIFAHEDGDLFGSFQCDDIEVLRKVLAHEPAIEEWQARMKPLLVRDVDPTTGLPRLMRKVFDLDEA